MVDKFFSSTELRFYSRHQVSALHFCPISSRLKFTGAKNEPKEKRRTLREGERGREREREGKREREVKRERLRGREGERKGERGGERGQEEDAAALN